MIRVLSVIHHTEFSGPTNRNIRIAPLLEKEGVHVTVLVPDRPLASAFSRLQENNIPTVTTRFHRLRATRDPKEHLRFIAQFRRDIQRIRAVIREHRIDIVQINGLMNPHGAIAARLEKKKVAWQLIDTHSPRLLMYMTMPFVVALSHGVMVTGRKTAKAHPLVRHLDGRLFYFYPPVDIESFTFDPAVRSHARKSLGLADKDLVVGTVGTINPQKGHKCFIDAASLLLKEVPDIKFVVLGSTLNTQQAYARSIRQYAREKGFIPGENMIFKDPRDRVSFFAQALDVFWMTSIPRSEGISTAVEEAMALGISVISADVGSMSEVVCHNETGYVVKPADSRAFAAYTRFLIDHPQVRHDMGLAARRMAMKYFSAQMCASSHLACYRHVMETP